MTRWHWLSLGLMVLSAAIVTAVLWWLLVFLLSFDLGQYVNHPGVWSNQQ